MKKFISAFIAVIMLCSVLCGCSVASPAYAEYDKYRITQAQYTYWLSYYKTKFYATFVEYGYVTDETYNEDFWNTEMTEGLTVGEMVVDHVNKKIKEMLICLKLCDELKLVSTKDAQKALVDSINSYIADDITAVGSRAELNRQLGKLGLNTDMLYTIYEIEAKCLLVEDAYYGTKGEKAVTDTEREDYYQNNYSRVKHILIDLNEKYIRDENGNAIMDTYTGYYKTEKLTAEEIAEREALGQTLYSRAKGGEDFETLLKEYNDDGGMSYYTDGYFVTKGSSYEELFLAAALDMTPGEVRLVKSSYGLHVIKKYPLEAGMWKNELNSGFFTDLDSLIIALKKQNDYGQYYNSIFYDTEFSASMNFNSIEMMSDELVSNSADS